MTQLPSGLPSLVEDSEPVARFLTSTSQFNAHGPKRSAFMPNPHDGTTSVFRHHVEPRSALWKLAIDFAVGERTLYGAAILIVQNVRAIGLAVVSDEDPIRHAVITNWPTNIDDPELEKAQRMEKALAIAAKDELILR